MERRNGGVGLVDVATEARAGYATCPDWADATDWAVECETLAQLLAGYFWRYENDNMEVLAAERSFEIPLTNPDSGKPSRAFLLTSTRLTTLRACPRRHYLRYELGLARVRQEAARRFGSAYHHGEFGPAGRKVADGNSYRSGNN